jgi:hypothetical protein
MATEKNIGNCNRTPKINKLKLVMGLLNPNQEKAITKFVF